MHWPAGRVTIDQNGCESRRRVSASQTESAVLTAACAQVRGLVKQQIDSFNFFLRESLRSIVMAAGNQRHTCDSDADWFLQYTDVRVGAPTQTVNYVDKPITPHECRLRDKTYSAPITVCTLPAAICG